MTPVGVVASTHNRFLQRGNTAGSDKFSKMLMIGAESSTLSNMSGNKARKLAVASKQASKSPKDGKKAQSKLKESSSKMDRQGSHDSQETKTEGGHHSTMGSTIGKITGGKSRRIFMKEA
jgi:hypothetical protein